MVSIKKIFPVLFLITIFTVTGVTYAADTKVISEQTAVSKHWDPEHPGHAHQCPVCHALYNQPGDSGPTSTGYHYCPYCYPGQTPVTPGNYVPQTPFPPAPPAPPQQPYPSYPPYPPYPPVKPVSITTHELIKMAIMAPTWEEHDRLLVNYVAYVSDLTFHNLLRLWFEARSWDANDQVLINGVSTHPFTADELLNMADKTHFYQSADKLLIGGTPMMKDISIENVFRLYDKAHTWAAGDQILIAAMPRLTTEDLFKLKTKAHYKETAQAIDEEIRRRQMSEGHSSNAAETSETNIAATDSRGIIKKAIAAINLDPAMYPVEKTDLTSENLDYGKIENFIRLAKEKKLKKSSEFYKITRVISEKLKIDALNGNREAEELLKELHLE